MYFQCLMLILFILVTIYKNQNYVLVYTQTLVSLRAKQVKPIKVVSYSFGATMYIYIYIKGGGFSVTKQ